MGLDIHILHHPNGKTEAAIIQKIIQLENKISADCMEMDPRHAAGTPFYDWPTSSRDRFYANWKKHKLAKAVTALERRMDDFTWEWRPKQDAPGYEGNICGLNYFRSSYNDAGFNRRCDYYLPDPYSAGFYYIFGLKDEDLTLYQPDWEEVKARAVEVRKAWEGTRDQFKKHTVEEIVMDWNPRDPVASPREALTQYLSQDYEHSLRGGYTRSGAAVFSTHDTGKIRAVYAGREKVCGGMLPTTHSFYVIWDHEERDYTHIEYCVDVCTIVVMACNDILSLPAQEQKNVWVYWSA